MPGLFLVRGEVSQADEFVQDQQEGEEVADGSEKGRLPADGDGKESGEKESEEKGGEHPPEESAVDAEQTPGDFNGAKGENQAESRIKHPVGNGTRGGELVFRFHDFVSRKDTF